MKKAFSILELTFVVLIISLILSIAKFQPKNDNRIFLAAEQILNDLNYVRSIALMQNSFRNSDFILATKDEWFKARWQLYFIRSKSATNNEQTYTIFLDKNGDGNANIGKTNINLDREIALNILNSNKLMNSGQSGVISKDDERASKNFNIEKSYGVNSIKFVGSCSSYTRIIFDENGRLYSPLRTSKRKFDKILINKDEDCIIKLTNTNSQNVCIIIDKLSGYAYIPEFKDEFTQLIKTKSSLKTCSSL
ncbi:prepilin-type cleavage/methylation domain-containing protein [uncultured Campylobacter sp.]|uniref:pilus assembly FimT family protein n=1 Tax=uncultured Campylobacter sp. TaxID=218934 RepID=UPI002631F838|nr:prepilin-type cleavage/methylation domain-containing protein [uncultured Campylobacter sp.]